MFESYIGTNRQQKLSGDVVHTILMYVRTLIVRSF